jgi:uncharacterized protein YyaL (SSP411 family)
MAMLTLQRMGEGGLRDQLGGGFCRYSVDERWEIPHFEKMLYDNGELLAVYAQAALATDDAFCAQVAAETADWAIRDLRSPEGAFYSSYDADSEGHEGRFYVWDRDEARAALSPQQYAVFAARFGLDGPANFEGRWHLNVRRTLDAVAAQVGTDAVRVAQQLDEARARLLAIRAMRVWPGRDDKILTAWNALMIRGLAIAARALRREDLAQAATRALGFIRERMWRDGRLLASYKDGHAHLNAYLDDHAFLADAILELQQVRFDVAELAFARELLEVLLRHFIDTERGGFYFTSDDHETLIHRSRSFSDDATPAGSAVASLALLRMGHLLGEPRMLLAAERTVRAAWPALQQHPQAHATLLASLEELLVPGETVVIRATGAELARWREALGAGFAPRRLVLAIPSDARDLPEALAQRAPAAGPVAYVCHGSHCSPALTRLEDVRLASAGH